MRKKSYGAFQGSLNARGHEQVDEHHYLIAAPVTNPMTIWLMSSLLCMNPFWAAVIIDVEGVFLQGEFENSEWVCRMVSRQCKTKNECTIVWY